MASLFMPSRRALCGALGRAVVFAALAISYPEFGRALDPASDALLKDAAAAADMNGALIQHGTAKYRIISKDFRSVGGGADGTHPGFPNRSRAAKQNAKTGEPMAAEMTVYFDYPNRLRFDWRGQRMTAGSNAGEVVKSLEWTIYDKTRKIHYSLVYGEHMVLGADPSVRPSDPRAYHVFINAANSDEAKTPPLMHPRQQTWPNWYIRSFGADALSRMRMLNDAQVTTAKEPDGLVRVAIRKTGGLDVYWLSPEQGYGIVRAKHWIREASEADEPMAVHEAQFRKTDNGAYVVEHRKSRLMRRVDGGLQPNREEEVTLLEIDMQTKLDPKQFTLDGLDLPVGAQVRDNISGTKYGYGVPAVAE